MDPGLHGNRDDGGCWCNRIELGKRNFTLDTLEEICKVLGVKAGELV